MKIKENKAIQTERLKQICQTNDVDFTAMKSLLESVRAKKIRKVNYHQQKIADVIEKSIK